MRVVGGQVRDPDLGLLAAPALRTDLHTLGEIERVFEGLGIAQTGFGQVR
jgi:hypothetical protein